MSKNTKIAFSLLTLIFTFIINSFFFFYRLGLGFALFMTMLVICFEIVRYFTNRDNYFNIYQFLTIPILFSIWTFFFRSDEFILTLNFLFLLFIFPAYIIGSINKRYFQRFSVFEYALISKLTSLYSNSMSGIYEILDRIIGRTSSNVVKRVFFAILVTLPIFTFVLVILASGDRIFANLAGEFLSNTVINAFDIPNIVKFTLAFLFSLLIWSFLKGFISNSEKVINSINPESKIVKVMDDIIFPTILVGSLNIIYLFFVFVQFGYLFGGEDFARANDVVFSEYAINGFWEMLTVIIINFIILHTFVTRFSIQKVLSKALLLPTYVFTIFSSFVMIISSFSRIMLYVEGYGYSRDRLIPLSFLFLVLTLFAFLLIVVFINDNVREKILNVGTILIGIIFLMIFSSFSMDGFIVSNNIKMDRELDYRYLINELSSEGHIQLLESIDEISNMNRAERKQVEEVLIDHIYYTHEHTPGEWQSWNSAELKLIEMVK